MSVYRVDPRGGHANRRSFGAAGHADAERHDAVLCQALMEPLIRLQTCHILQLVIDGGVLRAQSCLDKVLTTFGITFLGYTCSINSREIPNLS